MKGSSRYQYVSRAFSSIEDSSRVLMGKQLFAMSLSISEIVFETSVLRSLFRFVLYISKYIESILFFDSAFVKTPWVGSLELLDA